MYTVGRAPAKLAAKVTRIGSKQQIDLDIEQRELQNNKLGDVIDMSSPRPVFNGKKMMRSNSNNQSEPQRPISPQHEEIIRFLSDSWNYVQKEYENCSKQGRDGPVLYQDKGANQLQGFQPFDLESWWGKRTLENIHKNN